MNDVRDIEAELLDPAIGGVATILGAVQQKYGENLRCVVTTPFFAPISDTLKGSRGGYKYEEDDANIMLYEEVSTAPVMNVYSASQNPC